MKGYGHGLTGTVAHMGQPPYDKEEAETLRRGGRMICACFQCLVESKPKPYWPWESVEFGGAMIYCPAHWNSDGFGKVEVGDWLGP